MIQGKDRTSSLERNTQNVEQPAPLQFTPQRAVAAITFHLIDEGITKSVSAESAQRTINRLLRESFALSISANTWSVMSNPDRLRRLLEETSTEAALLADDTVILAHRVRKRS